MLAKHDELDQLVYRNNVPAPKLVKGGVPIEVTGYGAKNSRLAPR